MVATKPISANNTPAPNRTATVAGLAVIGLHQRGMAGAGRVQGYVAMAVSRICPRCQRAMVIGGVVAVVNCTGHGFDRLGISQCHGMSKPRTRLFSFRSALTLRARKSRSSKIARLVKSRRNSRSAPVCRPTMAHSVAARSISTAVRVVVSVIRNIEIDSGHLFRLQPLYLVQQAGDGGAVFGYEGGIRRFCL